MIELFHSSLMPYLNANSDALDVRFRGHGEFGRLIADPITPAVAVNGCAHSSTEQVNAVELVSIYCRALI